MRAFVEKLAGSGWHRFALGETTNRAYQHRFKKNFAHSRFQFWTDDGYPASAVALVNAAGFALSGSTETLAVFLSKSTLAAVTPGTLSSATVSYAADQQEINLVIGSADSTLVTRTVASWTSGSGQTGSQVFDSNGGVLTGKWDRPQSAPKMVNVRIAVDFTFKSGIPSYVKEYTVQLEDGTAATVLFKTYSRPIMVYFNFQSGRRNGGQPYNDDYFVLKWNQSSSGKKFTYARIITGKEIRKMDIPSSAIPVYWASEMTGPNSETMEDGSVDFVLSGRYRHTDIEPITKTLTDITSLLEVIPEKNKNMPSYTIHLQTPD